MTDWTQYDYHGFADHDDAAGTPATGKSPDLLDPTKYENQVRQTGRFTASVWAVHLNVPTFLVERTLEILDDGELFWGRFTANDLTHEYSTGGSWANWGEPSSEPSDNHLVVYFRASSPLQARVIGKWSAKAALDRYGGQEYVITTAGDFNTAVADLRRKGGNYAETAEAEGESGE